MNKQNRPAKSYDTISTTNATKVSDAHHVQTHRVTPHDNTSQYDNVRNTKKTHRKFNVAITASVALDFGSPRANEGHAVRAHVLAQRAGVFERLVADVALQRHERVFVFVWRLLERAFRHSRLLLRQLQLRRKVRRFDAVGNLRLKR